MVKWGIRKWEMENGKLGKLEIENGEIEIRKWEIGGRKCKVRDSRTLNQ